MKECIYEIPCTVKAIDSFDFISQEKLTAITTYSVTEIGDRAFKNYSGLKSVVILRSIT